LQLVAQYALSISAESLIIETGRVFGFAHLNEKIKGRIRDILNKTVREGKLVAIDCVVTVPNKYKALHS
jgi:hypothetical protein